MVDDDTPPAPGVPGARSALPGTRPHAVTSAPLPAGGGEAGAEGDGTGLLEPVPLDPLPPPERSSRAGRDLPGAVAVGLGVGLLALASLLLWTPAFVMLVVAAAGLGVLELGTAFAAGGVRLPRPPLLLGTVVMLVAAWAGGAEDLVVGLVLTVLAVALWRLPEGPHGYWSAVGAGWFTALYVPFLAGSAVLLAREDDGPLRVVVFVLAVVLSDTGGYVAGVLWGRRPMAPSVSPRKSWEGFGGSLVCACAGTAVTTALLLDGPWWTGAVVGATAAVAATVGDLGESLVKRDLGIKDMGTLLRGHGGVMDRLDSLLVAAPVVALGLAALVPVA